MLYFRVGLDNPSTETKAINCCIAPCTWVYEKQLWIFAEFLYKFLCLIYILVHDLVLLFVSVRLTAAPCCFSLVRYTVNHMTTCHGRNFNMLLTNMEVWLIFVCMFHHDIDYKSLNPNWYLLSSSDMFVEISDDENILQDREASNPEVRTFFSISF